MSSDAIALRSGEVFHGRYTVVRRIAAGGMGAVYEVVHQGTRRRCAMKLMLPALVADPELRARFQTEATIAARIGSEHIVDVFDAGVDEATGAPFLVMELLDGSELGSLLRDSGPLAPAEALVLLRQAALALGKTHAAGIVHRDLKPQNMFVTRRDDGSPRLKILDFGIARVVAESGHATKHTGMLGTPAYMAPEQVDAAAPLGPGADLFALGHVAYTMLVGEMYWKEEAAGGAYNLLLKVMAGPPEPPSARARRRRNVVLPPGFDGWFTRAIAHRPEDRFQSAAAQVTALADVLGAPSAATVSPAPPAEPVRSTLRSAPEPAADHTLPMPPLQVHVATAGAGATTTMPVSNEAVTRRLERPASKPSRLWVFAAALLVGLVFAIGVWRLASSDGSAPASSASASTGATATGTGSAEPSGPASSSAVPSSPSATGTTTATTTASASAPATPSTKAATAGSRTSKGAATAAPSSSKPRALDDGP